MGFEQRAPRLGGVVQRAKETDRVHTLAGNGKLLHVSLDVQVQPERRYALEQRSKPDVEPDDRGAWQRVGHLPILVAHTATDNQHARRRGGVPRDLLRRPGCNLLTQLAAPSGAPVLAGTRAMFIAFAVRFLGRGCHREACLSAAMHR
jgi:hypothetical protein